MEAHASPFLPLAQAGDVTERGGRVDGIHVRGPRRRRCSSSLCLFAAHFNGLNIGDHCGRSVDSSINELLLDSSLILRREPELPIEHFECEQTILGRRKILISVALMES